VIAQPRGFLIDFGDILVEELRENRGAGVRWLFEQASHVPGDVTLERVLEREKRVRRGVDAKRIPGELEVSWTQLMRLTFEPLGVRFRAPLAELELDAWRRVVTTRPLPGARDALAELRSAGCAIGVVSNATFSAAAIRADLAQHGLDAHLAFVIASSDYGVRKPSALLFEAAAARLGVDARDIWFVGDRMERDVAGANGAGMTAVWFRAIERTDAPREGASPDLIARSWSELVAFARSHGLGRA
jgi:putative hydrolase of the HAD superfamily